MLQNIKKVKTWNADNADTFRKRRLTQILNPFLSVFSFRNPCHQRSVFYFDLLNNRDFGLQTIISTL